MTESTPAAIAAEREFCLKVCDAGCCMDEPDKEPCTEANCAVVAFAERVRREERDLCAKEISWLRRLLGWARPRLRREGYEDTLDRYLAMGPQDQPTEEPPIIRSSQGE